MGEAKREPGPDAEAQCPACGLCGDETYYEDGGFQCDGCRIRYDGEFRFAAWYSEDDGDEVGQCSSRAVMTYASGGTSKPRRCRLHEGHRDVHRCDLLAWWGKDTPPLGSDEDGIALDWRTVTEKQAAEIEAAKGGGRRG